MAGTNAVRIKKALFDALTDAPALEGVQVEYSYPGPHVDRELIHGGKIEGPQSYPVMRGGPGRKPRQENLTFKVHIVVSVPGATPYEVELRCTELGGELENFLAANPDLSGHLADIGRQVIYGGVTYVDLDSDSDDEGAIAVLTYDVTFESRLR